MQSGLDWLWMTVRVVLSFCDEGNEPQRSCYGSVKARDKCIWDRCFHRQLFSNNNRSGVRAVSRLSTLHPLELILRDLNERDFPGELMHIPVSHFST